MNLSVPAKGSAARNACYIIAAAALYRIVFAGLFPLGPDECFYWDWSRRLDLSYVEHPPLVAYAIALMTTIFGDTNWASRALAIPIAALVSWLLFCTGSRLYNERVGFWAAVGHAVCPMFSMAGGTMLLPESLLTLWVTLALYLAARLVLENNLRIFYALGVVTGAGLLSKYPAILIPAALGLFALSSRQHRHWFARPQPYFMVAIALAMFSPVIIWNVQHDWMGLNFIANRTTALPGGAGLNRVWESLIGQAGYHSPILFGLLWYGAAVATYRSWKTGDARALLLVCFSVPVMLSFLFVSYFRHTLPHWPAAGYLATYIAAPAAFYGLPNPDGQPRRARWFVAAAIVGTLESALMPVLLVYPLTTVAYARVQRVLHSPPEVVEPMAEAWGWDTDVRDRLVSLRQRIIEEKGDAPVVMTHYHMLAGLLAYGMRDTCPVVSVHALARQYDVWYDDEDLTGKTVIYVSSDNGPDFRGEPGDYYRFATCTAEPPVTIGVYGVTVNTVWIWVCEGYAGPVEAHTEATAAP